MRLRYVWSALAAVVIASSSSLALAAENYKIDPEHAVVAFKITHLEFANAYGRFNDPTGTVSYDKEDPSRTTFNIEVQTANVDTDNEKRDAHLRSLDFFDAKQFPTITFKSTAVKPAGENKLEVTGDLTLHGVTKSITIPVVKTGEKDTGQMGYRTGWEANFNLKRSDYGMTNMIGPVGDEVFMIVSFEAVKG